MKKKNDLKKERGCLKTQQSKNKTRSGYNRKRNIRTEKEAKGSRDRDRSNCWDCF